MKKAILLSAKTSVQIILLLAIGFYSFGVGNIKLAQASSSDTTMCEQLVANAKAQFIAALSADGSVPASIEAKAAASEYIRVSKLCYEEITSQNPINASQTESPTFIDDGGILLGDQLSAQFILTGGKWGSSTLGTSGGTVTYSFMGSGLDLSTEPNSSGFGKSVALTSLPGFQVCFITEIQNAFAAWQAVSNIKFVQVDDSSTAFGASGATGDIRIGAHAFDGPSGALAHAYFPAPNAGSGTGDIHFDKAENWTCDTSGIDISIVALHEIGHSLGLNHEDTSTVAVMDPYYTPTLNGLQSDDVNGITTIYGAAALTASAPPNDNFANAGLRTISSIPYTDIEDTTGATREPNDPQVPTQCDGKLLYKGSKTVWYRYTPGANTRVSFDTIGSNYDTYIAVWTGTQLTNLSFVACDDDRDPDLQSQLVFDFQGGKTYYIEVAGYTGTVGGPVETNNGGLLIFNANLPNVAISIGGVLIERYYVPGNGGARRSYENINDGPVEIVNENSVKTLASQRVVYGGVSYSEMMGLPKEQLATEYWFPYYNNVAMNSQLRVSNMGSVPTTITVYLGTQTIDSYTLAGGTATRKNYTGMNSGPVRVVSSDTNILSTIRVLYGGSSYSELMGLPVNQLTNEYLFPYYNNVAMESQLRVSNIGGVDTTINVYLGSDPTPIDSYVLAAGTATRKTYAGKNSGPLKVTSSTSNILSSIRVLFNDNSFSELMGFPANKLVTRYWYPVYDNSNLNSQLRVSNVGSGPTTIIIYAAGDVIDSYTLAAGAATRKNYVLNTGAVRVFSNPEPILSTIRMLYNTPSFSSFYEMMGLPYTQLSTQYFFPWYNNVAMNSQLRLAIP